MKQRKKVFTDQGHFSSSFFQNKFTLPAVVLGKGCRKGANKLHRFLKNGPTLASFSFIFSLFKQTLQFYNKYMWKNVHPLNCAGIRTHDLRIVSLFPLPLDQGSRPEGICFFVMSKKFYATYLLLSANLNLSLSSSLEFRFKLKWSC